MIAQATPMSLATFRHASIARLGGLSPPQAGLASAFTPRVAAGERLFFLYPLLLARLSGLALFGGLDPAPAGRLNADAARDQRFSRPLGLQQRIISKGGGVRAVTSA